MPVSTLGLVLSHACVSGCDGHKEKNRAKPMQGPGRPPFPPAFSPSIDGLIFLLQPLPRQKRQNQQINHPHHHRPCLRSGSADCLASKRAKSFAAAKTLRANEQSPCLPPDLCSQSLRAKCVQSEQSPTTPFARLLAMRWRQKKGWRRDGDLSRRQTSTGFRSNAL